MSAAALSRDNHDDERIAAAKNVSESLPVASP
jgi:hypothetical protein